ncbi:MAG: hypothetical protein IT453_20045 [Planctomycetes bacterium]|nr:hypothetical protein [Planctomycetota bacterium]
MTARAVITGRTYRYVRVSHSFAVVEKEDGRDRLGIRRWREIPQGDAVETRRALNDFIEALDLRQRRARAKARRDRKASA